MDFKKPKKEKNHTKWITKWIECILHLIPLHYYTSLYIDVRMLFFFYFIKVLLAFLPCAAHCLPKAYLPTYPYIHLMCI